MTFDGHSNFGYSTVAYAPSPATTGTLVEVAAATSFPSVPFNATVWPTGVQPTTANAEIVRVLQASPVVREGFFTAVSTDIDVNPSTYRVAESFVAPASGTLTTLAFRLFKVNSPVDNVVAELRSDSGGSPGTLLSSVSVAASSLGSGSGNSAYVPFTFSQAVTGGTTYWMVLRRSGATDATNRAQVEVSTSDVYSGTGKESTDSGGTYVSTISGVSEDVLFRADIAASSSVFQILRTQESTSARTVVVGDQFAATISKKIATDLESGFSPDLGLSDMVATLDQTVAAATSAYVASDLEISNDETHSISGVSGDAIGNDNSWLGQSFRHRGTLSTVDLRLKRGAGATGTVILDLCVDNGGSPGPVLATASKDIATVLATSPASITFDLTDTSLAESVTYWLVVRTSSLAVSTVSWISENPATYTYASKYTGNAGATWNTQDESYDFRILFLVALEIASGAVLEIG